MRPSCALLIVGIAMMSIGAGRAQAPVTDAAQAAPVFKAGIDLVRLDVRVADDRGRPISDLRPDEVQVVEDRRLRPILLFQHIAEPSGGSVADIARETSVAEVSTNRGAPRGHLYVFVFDRQHISPGQERRARLAAERFLGSRLRPGDRVALYGLPGPGPQLDFTADTRRAAAELAKLRGIGERIHQTALGPMRVSEAYEIRRGNVEVLTRVASRLVEPAARADSGSDPTAFQQLVQEEATSIVSRADQQSRDFLQMFAELLRTLRRIDDRKSVLLCSEGFFLDNVTREVEQVASAAAQSYSVVYALDLNSRLLDPRDEAPRGIDEYGDTLDRLDPLAAIALETSGVLINDASLRLDAALDAIADQLQNYYLVGFEPHPGALKNREQYRRVQVRVSRPGARVTTRTGYAVTPVATPADRRHAIDAALTAPFPQQGLGLEYTTYVLRGASPGFSRVLLSVAAELPVASAGRTKIADVVFAVQQIATRRMMASGSDSMPLPITPQPGSTTGIGAYRVQFEVPPGEYLMRVVVREPGGLVGSADHRFSVPSLEGPGLTAGDLILQTPGASLPVRVTARPADTVLGLVELYAPTPGDLDEVDVTAELRSADGDRRVVAAAVDLLDATTTPRGSVRPARIRLPLVGIPSGGYAARVIVRAHGVTVRELARQIDVRDRD